MCIQMNVDCVFTVSQMDVDWVPDTPVVLDYSECLTIGRCLNLL